MNQPNCNCSTPKVNLVFACSGAADVGKITDLTARELVKEKTASMCCVAAIAAEIPEIIDVARKAGRLLVMDGCNKNCARIIMERAGFDKFNYLQLETLGMKKGESPPNDERLETALKQARLTLFT